MSWLKDSVTRAITVITLGSQAEFTTEQQKNHVEQLVEDIWQLRTKLPCMRQLIDQAERLSHNYVMADLLPSLRDAVYDAEDLIDEFEYYELKAKLEEDQEGTEPMAKIEEDIELMGEIEEDVQAVPSSSNFFFNNVSHGSFNNVKKVHGRLDHICSQIKNCIHLFSGELTRPETTSILADFNIFGRENEVQKLINLLLVPDQVEARSKRKRSTTVSVLPIVGLGGVGKTTLAQRIYNDKRVISHFSKTIWACISNEPDIKSLTKKVIHCLGKETPVGDLECLQTILAENVSGQRFLLVIDDMWDDVLNDGGQTWWRFCACLEKGLTGSMILVTTRSSKVAKAVCTMQAFSLVGFDDDVFWDFFKECIFGSESSQNSIVNYEELESIGKNIALKLKGSALAAKTLSYLLGTNRNPKYWKNVLKTELCDLSQEKSDILPTLRFSYIHLPSHLKRCFSFCAVYPKGYKFDRGTLVDIWVAQGFVEPQGAMPITSIGDWYFEDLVSRSLFEKAPYSYDVYIIHDLIHDMAQLVAKDECFIIKDGVSFQKIPLKVRHLSIFTDENVDRRMLKSLCKYKKLRSILCYDKTNGTEIYSVMGSWFDELPRIRVFSTCSRFSRLPLNIGNMKHLRYLNFSRATFMDLPSSFYHLYNMQILHAPESNIKGFAQDISNLRNLYKFRSRSLTIDEDKIIFDAADECGEGIRMFKYLSHFHGSLILHNLDKVSNTADAAEAELDEMMYLDKLTLCWSNYQHYGSSKLKPEKLASSWLHYGQNDSHMKVLTNLKPSKKIKCLNISNYSGKHMPIWLQQQALPQLRSLDISYCDQLVSIDLYGALNKLISVTIKACNNLSSLDVLKPEYFICIKKVCIERCQSLVYLPSETFEGFHSLEELHVVSCPKLKWSRSSGLPCSLRKLHLARCGDISDWIASCLPSLTLLTDLSLVGLMWVTYIPCSKWGKLTALKNLEIQQCEDLVSIDESDVITKIEHVLISGCPKLKQPAQPFFKGKWQIGDVEPHMQEKMQQLPDEQLVLQRSLSRIRDIIKLAEWSIHMDSVVNFIKEAKVTMYDTEDLLNELEYYELKLRINVGTDPSSSLEHARHSYRNNCKLTVEKIQEKVDYLTILMSNIGLHAEPQLSIIESMKLKRHPFREEHKMLGRQEELRKLIYGLCSTATGLDKNQANVSIVPVSGFSGIGKTTLAQHVFNDELVRGYFDMAIWISISDDLKVKLMKKFLLSVAEREMRCDALECVQRILSNGIIDESKRYLLVLDNMNKDILSEASGEFNSIVELLEHAKSGSKILVTTRSMEVANDLSTKENIPLGVFHEDVLWKLFKIYTFGSDSSNNLLLDDIGRSIVAKLDHSPLAVKIIGRILSLNLDTEYWRILASELWGLPKDKKGDLSALLLGYRYLPFHLKQCFSFCSLYPKGYEFDKATLVDCWIAVGLVELDGDMLVVDAGHFYFEQLVNYSFFHKAPASSKYVLPGLLHDVARFVSGNECYVIKDTNDLKKIPPNVRHLSILGQNGIDCSDLIYLRNHKKLLSLVCYDVETSTLIQVIGALFADSTRIRMLSFISCQMMELPEIMGSLKFLRYLDISACTFDRLPPFFWHLHSLEVLNAGNCKLKELPKDVTNLVNLRRLILKNTDHIVSQLRDIPGVGKLASLQEMPYFSVGNGHGRGIGELKQMNFLHGRMEISGLINVTSKDEAAEAELFKKVHLDTLILSWDESNSACHGQQASGPGMEMLEGLCPSPNIQHLEIKYFVDVGFHPSWFQEDILRNLTSLSFDSCPNLAKLSVGRAGVFSNRSSTGFPLLIKLYINRCKRLSSLDGILLPQILPAIKVIKIEKCDALLSLPTESFGGFIQLEELELRQCWNLKWGKGLVLPPFLKELKLEACGDISESTLSCLHNLISLTTLELQFCHRVESIPPQVWSNLRCLESLIIFYCKGLKSVGGSKAIATIKNVNITECPELQDLKQPFREGCFRNLLPGISEL